MFVLNLKDRQERHVVQQRCSQGLFREVYSCMLVYLFAI